LKFRAHDEWVAAKAGPDSKESIMSVFQRFVRNESGATAIEYGLIAAGIAVAIISVVNTLGSNLTTTFSKVSDNLAK
jgi:pilus assembly protein Flp/PilA